MPSDNTKNENDVNNQNPPLKASARVGKNKSKRKKSRQQNVAKKGNNNSKSKNVVTQNKNSSTSRKSSKENSTKQIDKSNTNNNTQVNEEVLGENNKSNIELDNNQNLKSQKNTSKQSKKKSSDNSSEKTKVEKVLNKEKSNAKKDIQNQDISGKKNQKSNKNTKLTDERKITNNKVQSKAKDTKKQNIKKGQKLKEEENRKLQEKQKQQEDKNKKLQEKQKQQEGKNKKLQEKQKQQEDKNKKIQENKKLKEERKNKKLLEKQELKKKRELKEKEEAKKLASMSDEDKKRYLQDKSKQKSKIIQIATIVIILLIAILFFSTIFAFLNSTKSTVIEGVKVNGVDISGMTLDEAKNKIQEIVDTELEPEITYTYGEDFTTEMSPNRIEANYNVDEVVNKAYNYGRENNIVVSNYQIIFSKLFGKSFDLELNYNKDEIDYFAKETVTQLPGVVKNPSYEIDGKELIIDSGKDGINIDVEKFEEATIEAIKNRNYNDIKDGKELDKVEIPVKEEKAEEINIEKIKEEIYKEPKDASFEKEPFKLIPDESGVDFAITIDEAKKMLEEEKDEYKIPLNITPANKTVKDIGMEAFPEKISSYSTRYDSSNTNRTTNLKLASSKIDGTVLMPGEEFSYNNVVGQRTIEAGYKDAKVYSNGSVVDGLGGGICQISTTLYNAVLLANLEVTDRRNHSFTTSYAPAGRDATVVYGSQDFKFKNTRTYPIKISAEVNSGIATMTINGIKEETEYEVRIQPHTISSIPYKETIINDPSLPMGKQVVQQAGHNGCKTETYKELVLNGTVVERTLISTDTYNAMTRIVRVGTKQ